MDFRDRLIGTLEAIGPVLEEPGVLVVGSEVPNLLGPANAAPLVISRDVDIGVPVAALGAVKRRLGEVRGFRPAAEEPSVWLSEGGLLEVNFLGIDPGLTEVWDNYVLEDADMPLMVFGALSLLRPGPRLRLEAVEVPLPALAGLLVEKLLTERSGLKGDRDLLVALGILIVAAEEDLSESVRLHLALGPAQKYAVKSNLAVLSLMEPLEGMPDPLAGRERVAALLRQLERAEGIVP